MRRTKTAAKAVALAVLLTFGVSLVSTPVLAAKRATKKKSTKKKSTKKKAKTKRSKAAKAVTAAVNKANKPKGLLGARVVLGGSASFGGFASRFTSIPKELGKLVPMEQIVKELKAQVRSGKVLPGDPTLLEYERWKRELGKSASSVLAKRRIVTTPLDEKEIAPGELTMEQRKEFGEKYAKLLIPDLKTYVLFVYDMVLVPKKLKDKKQAADLMFQYACRALSRVLPGYAKIVEVRLPGGGDTAGDWDKPFPIDQDEKKKQGGADKGPPPNKPEPPIEVVEVCSVTHKQVEVSLQHDLLSLAKAVAPKAGKARDITVLSGAPKLSGKEAPVDIDDVKMEKYDANLKDLTFRDVTKRLMNFYRKKGFSRNFARAAGASKSTAKRLSKSVQAKTPKAAKGEAKFHSDEKIISKRNSREELRRAVEMWTYGYEYESVAHLVIKKKAPLKSAYTKVEDVILDDFWSDCKEIAAICDAPVEKLEVKACQRCALDAFEHYCVEGKSDKGKCRVIEEKPLGKEPPAKAKSAMDKIQKVIYEAQKKAMENFNKAYGLSTAPGTLKEWLAIQLARAGFRVNDYVKKTVKEDDFLRRTIAWVFGSKFFAKEENAEKGYTRKGLRYLDALPLTTWQRCMLWNPAKDAVESCSKSEFGKLTVKDLATKPWHQSIIGKEIAKVKGVTKALAKARSTASGFLPIDKLTIVPTGGSGKGLTVEQKKAMGSAADGAADVAGPIVGKLLGMLLQAAGMMETMKMLARAAGMNPQQSADCEDMEYRHEVMKLSGKEDNKRSCLMKIFAKNFTNVLENIIVMLGNKLVDWGVDLIRNVLQPVKSTLLSAAGSVPFAGGFLAVVVDIVWELLMNFALKALLKGFVVAKLPEWLKVRELAAQPFEKVLKHPIVQAVVGVILFLIDAAMVHGEKSWMEVGVETVLQAIQKILENPGGGKAPEYFWLRALTFAKKKLRETSGIAGGSQSVPQQIEKVAKAMIEGFFTALQRRLDAEAQAQVEEAKSEILGLDFVQLASQLVSKPTEVLKVLREKIAPQIGRLVLPIVAAFAPMPGWTKQLLSRVGGLLHDLLSSKGASPGDAMAKVVEVLEPLGLALVGQVPIADPTAKAFLTQGYTTLVSALKSPNLASSLSQPGPILKTFVDAVKPVLVERAAALLPDAQKAGFAEALGTIATALTGGAGAALAGAADKVSQALLALVTKLEHPASKAFSYAPLQGLLVRACQMLAKHLQDPSKLSQSLASGATFAKIVLKDLTDVLAPFASDAVALLVPPGLGRKLALAAIAAASAVLADPTKLIKLAQDAKSGFGKVVKRILGGSGGLVSLLLDEVKSDALRKVLELGTDFALSQIAK